MKNNRAQKSGFPIMIYLLMLAVTVTVAFPFVWMIFSSFKELSEFYTIPPKLLPEKFILDNYAELFSRGQYGKYYLNSILITSVQVVTSLLIDLAAGYGFAKFEFKFRNGFFLMILSSTMIPWVATIIPLFILASKLDMIDTYRGLILVGMADATFIFLARNFMTSVPTPLLEAARIDGAGEFTIFRRVVLPLVKPLIAVIGIQKMISSWNAFQWPLLIVNSDKYRTLPLAIAKLSSQYEDAYDLKMAAAVVAIIPIIIIYIAFQKYFTEGISLSGIK